MVHPFFSIFCEKVRYVEGSLDFLQAAGFREVVLDNEKFLIWSKENVDQDYDRSSNILFNFSRTAKASIPLTTDLLNT